MTTELPDTHPAPNATGPLALKSNLVLGPNVQLVERLRKGAAPLDDPNLNDEAAEAIGQLYAELQREHADHAQTVDDAAEVARENTMLKAHLLAAQESAKRWQALAEIVREVANSSSRIGDIAARLGLGA